MLTATFVAEFASEQDALRFVRDVVEDGQGDLVDDWALGWEDERGKGEQIAAGHDLADRAIQSLAG